MAEQSSTDTVAVLGAIVILRGRATLSVVVLIGLATLVYALFGIFNAQAGGRIDAALGSAIFNGLAAAIAIAVVMLKKFRGDSPIAAQVSGVIYSVLAGLAVGVFSIVLIDIYRRGGQLSNVFPIVYGGAIGLTALAGWLILGDNLSTVRIAAVCLIVAGIGLLASS